MPPTRHSLTEMHRSTNDTTGADIAVDKVLVTDGSGGFTYEDYGGGSAVPFDHGAMGATETLDLADGDWHRGILDDDCAITVTGFTADEGVVMLFEVTQDGTGGFGITWDADVDFGGGDDQPSLTADTTTTFMLWSSLGDATIYGAKVGAAATLDPATTVEDETTFGISPAVGTDLEYARQDHTHGTPGDDELQAAGHYEVMMDGSSPPNPLENGSGTDWLYVWVYP